MRICINFNKYKKVGVLPIWISTITLVVHRSRLIYITKFGLKLSRCFLFYIINVAFARDNGSTIYCNWENDYGKKNFVVKIVVTGKGLYFCCRRRHRCCCCCCFSVDIVSECFYCCSWYLLIVAIFLFPIK